jgi:hypothetical protein
VVARQAAFRATATIVNAFCECSPGKEVNSFKNNKLHASAQQMPRGVERVRDILGATADAWMDRWLDTVDRYVRSV